MKIRFFFAIFTLFLACTSLAGRSAPVNVDPLLAGGYVYTVPHWSSDNGTNQNGGYIHVFEAKTGMKAWSARIYKTKYNSKLERDVQDVFITEIRIDIYNTILTIKDELGRKFELDLKTKKIINVE